MADNAPQVPLLIFRIGDAFPADDHSAALLRFWITTRHALSIARSMVNPLVRDVPEEVSVENGTFLILLNAAVALESSKAFVDADRLGCFKDLPFEKFAPHVADALDRARRECDESAPDSLRSRLERIRNNAGAHWSAKLVLRGLRGLQDEKVAAMVGGPSHYEGGRPLAGLLMHKVLEGAGIAMDDVPKLFPRIQALAHDFRDLADFAIAARISPVAEKVEGGAADEETTA